MDQLAFQPTQLPLLPPGMWSVIQIFLKGLKAH